MQAMRTYMYESADESVALIKTLESKIGSEFTNRINPRFESEGL